MNKYIENQVDVNEEEQELTPEDYLADEEDILASLLDAANDKNQETAIIEVARKGRVYFRFRIRGLTEEEYETCLKKASEYTMNKRTRVRVREDINVSKFHSLLIYTATIDEDRKKIWDNKEAWKQMDVLSAHQLIDKVLLVGEKEKIVEKIEEISGYGVDLEEELKN